MASGDGHIVLKTLVDTKGVKDGMSSLTSAVKKVGGALAAAFSVKVLVDFGKKAIDLASDLQEVQNVVDVAFGDMAYKIEAFSKTAIDNFGISELTAKRTASTYMAMAKGMGIVDETASDMAITMTGLSADIASFYNLSQERADVILKSVYTGETETLKQLGIVMTDVNLQNYAMSQGITKNISKMSQQEKTMLRYQFVLEQTKLASGDFARTQDSWANQTRILAERWKQMQTVFGEAFMTVGTLVLPALNGLISGLAKVAEYAKIVAQWIYKAFTGKEIKATESQGTALSNVGSGASDAAQGMADLGNATEKAGKQAKKSLAGFDDLEILTSNIASNAGGASGESGGIGGIGGIGGNVTFDSTEGESEKYTFLQEKLDELLSALNGIKNIDLTNLATSLKLLKEPLKELGEVAWDMILFGIQDVIVPLADFTIESVLPSFIEALSSALRGLKTILDEGWVIIKQFYTEFLQPIAKFTAPYINKWWEDFNIHLKRFVDQMEGSTAWQDFSTILKEIYDILKPILEPLIAFTLEVSRFTMNEGFWVLESAFKALETVLGVVAALIQGDWKKAWDILTGQDGKTKTMGETAKDIEDVVAQMDSFERSVWNASITVAEKLLEMKTDITTWWTDVTTCFTTGWNDLVKDADNFFNAEDGFVQTWKTNISKWWDEQVAPWFTWEKWSTVFGTLKENFKTGFVNAINAAIELLNKGINKINTMLKFEWDALTIAGKEIVPSGSFSLGKIPNIPPLAKGTVVPPNREFLALLGDNKQEHEIVSPISTMKQAFTEAMLEIGMTGQPTKEEHYYLNETELMSVIYKLVKGGERIKGNSLITGGVY